MCRFLWTRAAASDLLVEREESSWLWLICGLSASVCGFNTYSEHLSAASHDRFINEQLLQEPDCFHMKERHCWSSTVISSSRTVWGSLVSETLHYKVKMWQWRITMLSDDWVDLVLTCICVSMWAWPVCGRVSRWPVGVSMLCHHIISICSTIILQSISEAGFTGRPITQIPRSGV